jgi:CheY-like chemotaxis protein
LDLLNGTTLTERQREYAQMARTASLSLLDVLNSILDFSKSEAGKMKLEAVDFPLRPRLEAALGPLRLAARAKGLEFAINWDPQLNTHYVGDPLRLAQVLTNLTSNAIKFTRAGVVGVRAQLQERQAGADRVTFTVRDTGAGIPEDVQVRLFEPFEQAGTSTSRQYGGSGLGLAICKQLVELMGGQLSLASVVGKGSSFSFTVALPAAASRPLVEELPRPIAPQPGVRVLVAEDNAVSRKVVVALLERLGHQVDTVTNGEEAVTAAATGSYALVLMDCQMPVLDGLAAAEQIRAAGVNSPIIALTASAAQEDRARALAAGMDDYLAKPYSADQLANLLAGITSRRSSAQAGG